MRKLKVGFIGCGGIAAAHADRLSRFNDVELTAFSDLLVERAQELASRYGGRAYTSWREMLDRESLDAVFVCLPPFAHEDEVEVAAEKGVHIYIEKPIALDVGLAERMVEAVKKHGVKSQVGYQLRFSFAAERTKQLIDSGEVGSVGLAVGAFWCRFLRTDWWIDRSKSGGQLVEQATHLYDLLRWFCGEVSTVYAEMDRLFYRDIPGMTIEDTSGVVLRFRSGAIGVVSSTIGAVPERWWTRWSIIGTGATIEADGIESLKVYYSTRRPLIVEALEERGRDPLVLAERDFIDAVLHDREARVPIEEGARTLKLTLAAARAAEEHAPVQVE